jgi:hypothetical protein
LEERTCLGPWQHPFRALREGDLLREAAEIHFPVRAWIDFGREPLTSRGNVVYEQRLGRNRGRGL